MHKMLNLTDNQAKILALLFAHPDEGLCFSQIGEALNKHPGVFQRGLNALVKAGILISKKERNLRVFSIASDYFLIDEVRNIINRTVGVEAALRELLGNMSTIQTALIYGSYAKKELHPGSDIDLLLVATTNSITDSTYSELIDIEKKIQREINCKVYLSEEFKTKIRNSDPFLSALLKEPIILLKGAIK